MRLLVTSRACHVSSHSPLTKTSHFITPTDDDFERKTDYQQSTKRQKLVACERSCMITFLNKRIRSSSKILLDVLHSYLSSRCLEIYSSTVFIPWYIASARAVSSNWCTWISVTDQQIDLNAVDLKKLRVKQLKKILSDWDEECVGCLEKTDFIRRIEQLKTEHQELW